MSSYDGVEGARVVVTGASSGIGRSIAELFVAAGARVVTGSRRDPQIVAAHWQQTDVSNSAQADRLIEATVEALGGVDVVVNNAGVQLKLTVADTSDEEFAHVMGVNLAGVFYLCRAAVRQMQAQDRGGVIINIGSIAGDGASDHAMAVYNASKAAVHALTRSIAIDHGADGIRCNAVLPGWITTAMADDAFAGLPDPAAARVAAVKCHPVGRLGIPSDVAGLVLWLASAEATFVSGSLFTIDGGLTAQTPISL